jgi:Transposase IS116/IS110/IS902 family
VDSAQQMIAEVDAKAVTFLSAKQLSSCVGTCPGDDESAGVSKSHRSNKGNRHIRRILNQPANDAAKPEGTIFRACLSSAALAPPTQSNHRGHRTSAGHLIWIILHQGVSYQERGPLVHGPGDARQFIGDCDTHLVARCTLREPMHHLSNIGVLPAPVCTVLNVSFGHNTMTASQCGFGC